MTDDTLKRLANEAGIVLVLCVRDDLTDLEEWRCETEELARFAALVRAQALEDAALTCEGIAMDDKTGYGIAEDCAAAIRALP
jgi:hypothetical protein